MNIASDVLVLIIFVQQAKSHGMVLTVTKEVIQAAGTKFHNQLDIPVSEHQKLFNSWHRSNDRLVNK